MIGHLVFDCQPDRATLGGSSQEIEERRSAIGDSDSGA